MRHILLLVLVVFSWSLALAQDALPPTDSPIDDEAAQEQELVPVASGAESLTFEAYFAKDFGFKISVPTTGELQVPGDLGWGYEPEVAFIWHGDASDPVARVEFRADNIGSEITDEEYAHFYDTLVSQWESKPAQFTVLRSRNEPFHFGEMDWLIIEIEDNSAAVENGADEGESTTVYYTLFITKQAEMFYTVGFFYREPVSSAVQELAVPMLRGFSITE